MDTGKVTHCSTLPLWGNDDPFQPISKLPAHAADYRVSPTFEAGIARWNRRVVIEGDLTASNAANVNAFEDFPLLVVWLPGVQSS